MGIEPLQSAAQVVQDKLSVRRPYEAVLHAFAETGEQVLAFPAVPGQGPLLVRGEELLPHGEGHLLKRNLHHASEAVFRIHVVVTGIDATVMLHG